MEERVARAGVLVHQLKADRGDRDGRRWLPHRDADRQGEEAESAGEDVREHRLARRSIWSKFVYSRSFISLCHLVNVINE